ncbi:MAG: hypothetical protein AYK18_05995 [Theionarchaea archaeon DG-70]|nr:MAG: hypothetical protein AYK18_05995 [Theionarchaea archaeon DG-70]
MNKVRVNCSFLKSDCSNGYRLKIQPISELISCATVFVVLKAVEAAFPAGIWLSAAERMPLYTRTAVVVSFFAFIGNLPENQFVGIAEPAIN